MLSLNTNEGAKHWNGKFGLVTFRRDFSRSGEVRNDDKVDEN